jgi:hypothetical protein
VVKVEVVVVAVAALLDQEYEVPVGPMVAVRGPWSHVRMKFLLL